MDFDELDRTMRVFETNSDQCVLPSIYMVARIDGRSFTRLTKERTRSMRHLMHVCAITCWRPPDT